MFASHHYGAGVDTESPEGKRCLYLMLSLIALLVVYPYVIEVRLGLTLITLLNSATLVTGIYAVSDRRSHIAVALAIAVPQLALAWWNVMGPTRRLELPAMALLSLFYGFTLYCVLKFLFRGRAVTRDKIHAAISVYLLMGLAWGSVYVFFETLQPGSFATTRTHPLRNPDLMYFSFATLTTLGYGDITPAAPKVQSLAILESASGVLYLATLVARLVGLYESDPRV